MDFTDKNVKRITPIILPDGRPGAYVVYTDTDPDTPQGADPGPEKRGTELSPFHHAQDALGRPGRRGPEERGPEEERNPAGSAGPSPQPTPRTSREASLVGMVITALYLLISTL